MWLQTSNYPHLLLKTQAHSLCSSRTSPELQYYMRFELHLQPPNKCMSVWAVVLKPARSFCLSGEECCVKTIRCSRARGSMLRTDNLLLCNDTQMAVDCQTFLSMIWNKHWRMDCHEWGMVVGYCFMMELKEQILIRKQIMHCFQLNVVFESEYNWVEVDNCSLGWWKSCPLAFFVLFVSYLLHSTLFW